MADGWLADERSNVWYYFRDTHSECISRRVLTTLLVVHITSPSDLSYFKGPYSKTTKTHNDTGQTNKYSKQ